MPWAVSRRRFSFPAPTRSKSTSRASRNGCATASSCRSTSGRAWTCTLEVGGLAGNDDGRRVERRCCNTDSSEVGTVIEERAIKELPLNGRNFAALVYLAPGITPGQAGENLSGASTFNPRGASLQRVRLQANSNGWLIDGIDNNEFTFNTLSSCPRWNRSAIQSVDRRFSAEFGRGAGVVGRPIGHQPLPWHGLRVPAQRCLRCPQLFCPQDAAGRRLAAQGSGAAARSASVRRCARRRAGDPGPPTMATTARSSLLITRA